MPQLSAPRDDRGNTIQALAPDRTDKLAVTSAAAQVVHSQAAQVVRLKATVDCHVRMAAGATTNDMLLSAGETEYFSVRGGGTLSVIREGTSDGSMYVTEMF